MTICMTRMSNVYDTVMPWLMMTEFGIIISKHNFQLEYNKFVLTIGQKMLNFQNKPDRTDY